MHATNIDQLGGVDQVFSMQMEHRLERHLGENSRLVVVKNVGHVASLEKSKVVCKSIISYFQEPASSASIGGKKSSLCVGYDTTESIEWTMTSLGFIQGVSSLLRTPQYC